MDNKVMRTFRVSPNLFFKFKAYAASQKMSSYTIILETLIEQYLKDPTAINEILKNPKKLKKEGVDLEKNTPI